MFLHEKCWCFVFFRVFLVCLMGLFVMVPDVEWRGARTATLQPGHGDNLEIVW